MTKIFLALNEYQRIIKTSVLLAVLNFRLRIEGNYLGVFWYLLNPLSFFLVILFIKNNAFSGGEIINYPIYLIIGLTGLHFFQDVISKSITAISGQTSYIKSMNNINPIVLVLSVVFQSLFSHFFELVMVICFLIYFKVSLLGLIFYPILLFFFLFLVTGLSLMFASVGVYIKDSNNVWAIISQLLLLFTPIFYVVEPGSLIYKLNLFNPLFYFLEIFRALTIYETWPPIWLFVVFVIASLVVLFLGILTFNRLRKNFSELV